VLLTVGVFNAPFSAPDAYKVKKPYPTSLWTVIELRNSGLDLNWVSGSTLAIDASWIGLSTVSPLLKMKISDTWHPSPMVSRKLVIFKFLRKQTHMIILS
jgi:hypothetical protein